MPNRAGNVTNPDGIGGFEPGRSGNPGGRPKSLAAMQLEARRYASEAIQTLVELMRNGEPDATKRGAANDLLDRGFGRPAQNVDLALSLNKKISELSLAELEALEAKLLAASTLPALTDETGPVEAARLPLFEFDAVEAVDGVAASDGQTGSCHDPVSEDNP